MKRIGLHRLIDRITTNAMMERSIHNGSRSCGKRFIPQWAEDMPGYRIQQLAPEEREALSHAKAEDFSWRGSK